MTTETDFVIRNLHFKLNWTGKKIPLNYFILILIPILNFNFSISGTHLGQFML